MSQPIVVGIAGCSGSGKTALAANLVRSLGGIHFHLDSYYRDLAHLSYQERCNVDFDDPEMLESALLAHHVAELRAGRAIDRPIYDFSTHTRVPCNTEYVSPAPLIVVEGLFALYFEQLRPLLDLLVYVDTPDGVCYERRPARDVDERGRTPASIAAQYATSVRLMAERYVRPSSQYVDAIVDGTASIDWSLEQIVEALCERNLLPQSS